MAFVNEYVSEDNIKKYDLEGLWKQVAYVAALPDDFRHTWTWDSEQESFYIPMSTGREEYSSHTTGTLYFKGVPWIVTIAHRGGSSKFSEKPYKVTWGLISIKHPNGNAAPTEDLIPVLKEALIGYKAIGISILGDLDVETSFAF